MPPWLIGVLVQFPIVVVIGFVAWYAYHQVKETNAAAQKREKEIHEARLADLRSYYEKLAAAKDQEIARLRDELTAAIKDLGRQIGSLERKLKALGD